MEEQDKSGIFRKSALDSISSPEQLTDYLKVANPGVWLILVAICLLIAGFFAWSMTAKLEMTADGKAEVKNGIAQIVQTDGGDAALEKGLTVRIDDLQCRITEVAEDPFGRQVAYASVEASDGIYDVKIVTGSIAPIYFFLD